MFGATVVGGLWSVPGRLSLVLYYANRSSGLDLDLDILLQVTYLFTAQDSLHDSTHPNQS